MSRTCDAVVIGGGVIGCAVAGELRKAGVEVVVIEKAQVGQEASSAAAGMLTALLDADEDKSGNASLELSPFSPSRFRRQNGSGTRTAENRRAGRPGSSAGER